MKSKYLFSFSLLALFLVGCGGSSTSQEGVTKKDNPQKKEVKTIIGHIIDSPIWGLAYSCKGQKSQMTDKFGTFECESLPVTFKVGNLIAGYVSTMPKDKKIYPQDIVGVSRDKVDDSDVVALTRFFQTLDDDGDIEEAIKIEPSLAKKLSFKSEVDFANLDEKTIVNKIGRTLVEKEVAQKHLRKNLVTGKKPTAIELSLLSPTLPKGLKSKATVSGIYEIDGGEVKSIIAKDVTYSSSDKNIATIESDGKIIAHDEGIVEISAKYGNLTDTTKLRVTHTTLTKIEISTPTMAELTRLALGREAFFRVKGFYSADGIEKDVTSQVIWSSKSPLLSDIDATNPNNNNNYYPYRLKANGVGKASLLATLFDLTDKVEFDIQASEITRIGININSVKIPLGSTISRYNLLLGYYADDSNRTLDYNFGEKEQAISWTVDNENILEYSNLSSQYIAKEKGEVTLTAKYKTFEDSIKLTIVDPAIKTLVIHSDNNVYIGDSTKVSVIGNYTNDKEENVTSKVLFKSLNPAIFSITPDGNLTALKEGYGHFEVTYIGADKNITSTKYITVQKPYVAPVPISIAIDATDEIYLGIEKNLAIRVTYSNDSTTVNTYPTGISWELDNSDIAVLTSNYHTSLQALKIGEVTVTAKLGNLTTSKTFKVVAPTSIAINFGDSNEVALSTTRNLSLVASYENGSTQTVSSDVYWEIANSNIAKLNVGSRASLQAIKKGEVTITAKFGGLTASQILKVVGPTSLMISSEDSQEMPIGTSKSLNLQAIYSDGSTLNVAREDISWAVDNSDIGTISGNYYPSLQALKKGNITVTATYSNLTATKTFKVVNPVLESINIESTYPDKVFIGEIKQFNVIARYSDGSEKNINENVTWNLMSNIASVTTDGKVTGTLEGSTRLKVSYQGRNRYKSITVYPIKLTYIEAVNLYRNIDINSTVQLQVLGTYNNGTKKELTQNLTWKSDDENIATVDNTGKMTAKGAGNTIISVKHNELSSKFYIFVQ